MPELPEVESLRRMLARSLAGRSIATVTVRERRMRRPLSPDFAAGLEGRTIVRLRRRAKYLLLDLSSSVSLLTHLGMSGSFTHRGPRFDPGSLDPAHDHVCLGLDDGSVLVYNDPRRFGLLKLLVTDEAAQSVELRGLGPEPFSAEFNADYLAQVTRGRRAAIKNLLMDQRVVAGVGNIYASEILFRAGVRPTRRAGRVRRAELALIAHFTPLVLRQAIGRGGTTFRSYRDSNGRPGQFALELKVYGLEGQPCQACGSAIQNRVVGQRASFYCPSCQR